MPDKTISCTYSSDNFVSGLVLDRHCHLQHELIFIFDGEITVNVEGENRLVRSNMLIAVEPLKYHTVMVNDGGLYDRFIIRFDISVVPESIRADFIAAIKKDPVAYSKEISRAIGKMREIYESESKEKFRPLLESCFTQICYAFALKQYEAGGAPLTTPLVSKIISYINDNLTKKITLEKLAAAMFLSVSTVCHVFKKEMNITVKQYILQKKLSYAEELMRSGHTAILASQTIGYYNYVNFYNAYKKLFGKAPSISERG